MRLHGGKRARLALGVREARLGSEVEVEVVEEGEVGLIVPRVDHPDGRHDVRRKGRERKNAPQRTSPPMSCTLSRHFLPSSPSQNFALSTLPAMDSTSLVVSFLSTAAKTKRPLPMVLMSSPSTVTEADFTRWITAGSWSVVCCYGLASGCLTLHVG